MISASLSWAPLWFVRELCRGDGYVELRVKIADTGRIVQRFFPSDDPEGIHAAAMRACERGDVWVGMCLRGRERGRAQDCVSASFLWADLDRGDEGLARCPVRPSLLIESGTPGHLQAFWRLEEPVDLTNGTERGAFIGRLRSLQRAVGSDPVADLPRVMRYPGTLNFKGPEPVVVAPVEWRP